MEAQKAISEELTSDDAEGKTLLGRPKGFDWSNPKQEMLPSAQTRLHKENKSLEIQGNNTLLIIRTRFFTTPNYSN